MKLSRDAKRASSPEDTAPKRRYRTRYNPERKNGLPVQGKKKLAIIPTARGCEPRNLKKEIRVLELQRKKYGTPSKTACETKGKPEGPERKKVNPW